MKKIRMILWMMIVLFALVGCRKAPLGPDEKPSPVESEVSSEESLDALEATYQMILFFEKEYPQWRIDEVERKDRGEYLYKVELQSETEEIKGIYDLESGTFEVEKRKEDADDHAGFLPSKKDLAQWVKEVLLREEALLKELEGEWKEGVFRYELETMDSQGVLKKFYLEIPKEEDLSSDDDKVPLSQGSSASDGGEFAVEYAAMLHFLLDQYPQAYIDEISYDDHGANRRYTVRMKTSEETMKGIFDLSNMTFVERKKKPVKYYLNEVQDDGFIDFVKDLIESEGAVDCQLVTYGGAEFNWHRASLRYPDGTKQVFVFRNKGGVWVELEGTYDKTDHFRPEFRVRSLEEFSKLVDAVEAKFPGAIILEMSYEGDESAYEIEAVAEKRKWKMTVFTGEEPYLLEEVEDSPYDGENFQGLQGSAISLKDAYATALKEAGEGWFEEFELELDEMPHYQWSFRSEKGEVELKISALSGEVMEKKLKVK